MKTTKEKRRALFGVTCVLSVLFFAASCGGGGGFFNGLSSIVGQVLRPATGLIESNPIPFGRASVLIVDFASGDSGQDVRTTDSGTTDDNGNFSVTIQGQNIAAIVVRGSAPQEGSGSNEPREIRISGLVNPDDESKQKNLDGVTDIAAEAGLGAIAAGEILPNEFNEENVRFVEDASLQLLQANPGRVNFFNAAQVTAAALAVRAATNGCRQAAPAGSFDQIDIPQPTPSPTPSPTPRPRRSDSNDDDDDDDDGDDDCDSTFTCTDGSTICADLVCNQQANCPDSSDESADICSNESACCTATQGCPSETASSCGETCCCCPLNQICDRTTPANGCIVVTSGAANARVDSRSELSKLFFVGPYWE